MVAPMTLTEKKQKLMKVLEVLFENLQEQGLMPKDIDTHEKDKLIDDVAEKLLGKVEHLVNSLEHDVNGSIKKTLSLCLITEFVAEHNPQFKLKYDKLELEKLFDKDLSLKEQQLELKNQFTQLLLALNELIAKPELRLNLDTIKQQAEELAEQCTKGNDKECLAENEAAMNKAAMLINDLLADTLSNLFGGLDPRSGITVKPVLVEKGNPMAITDQSATNAETSKAFIDVINRPEGNEALGIVHQLNMANAATGEKLAGAFSAAPTLKLE